MIKLPFVKHILRWLVNNQTNFYRFSIFLHMYNLAWLFDANSESSSGQACQALGNQCPSIGIMNAWMCLRNKYYGMTQSRSSVRPNYGKLEINTHSWEKVVLCHKFYAHLDMWQGSNELSILPIMLCSVMPGSKTVPDICHSKIWLHSTPILNSNTPLHNSAP